MYRMCAHMYIDDFLILHEYIIAGHITLLPSKHSTCEKIEIEKKYFFFLSHFIKVRHFIIFDPEGIFVFERL